MEYSLGYGILSAVSSPAWTPMYPHRLYSWGMYSIVIGLTLCFKYSNHMHDISKKNKEILEAATQVLQELARQEESKSKNKVITDNNKKEPIIFFK